ncbi:hypothetical protein [Listeria phage LMTA-57]|uniref:Uncharacterized protein n=1 Tax=Listeria phage LMTA-57 TaxID=1486414 RepID=A0A068C833_9CAUD|nr:hypothetical protein QLX42_gp054 [Listeria phage LMTA-57]AID17508.1 hypothetical protein [Listeria phage LMTA-57]
MIKVDKVECKDGRVYYVYNSNNGYNKKNICINGKVQTVPKDKYEKYLPKLSEIKKLDTLYMSNKNQCTKKLYVPAVEIQVIKTKRYEST